MNGLALTASGNLSPPPLPLPPKTCLFFNFKGRVRDSWSYFARNSGEDYRTACTNSIVAGGGNAIIVLLSNTDSNAPVSFWEDRWGGHVDMQQLAILERHARLIAAAGGALWPCFFCDENENAVIRNAPMEVHQRAFGLLIAHLRPYVPGFCIGLESSEYFGKARHNEFARLIRHFAPDRYLVSHMQSIPDGGMPDIDAWFFEHSWDPNTGDEHSPEEVVQEVREAVTHGKYVWPTEYSTKINGQLIRKQSRALLSAGFGVGGPVDTVSIAII